MELFVGVHFLILEFGARNHWFTSSRHCVIVQMITFVDWLQTQRSFTL